MAVNGNAFAAMMQPVRSVADYENAFQEQANSKLKNALAMRQMAMAEREMAQQEEVSNALARFGITDAGADAVSKVGGMRGLEVGMKIRAQLEAQRAQAEAQRKEQQRQEVMRSLVPVQGIDANRVSGVAGPRPEALNVVGQRAEFDPAKFLAAGMDPKTVEGIQGLVAPKPKVKDYKPVQMPDGSVQLVGLTEDGRTVNTGQTPFEKPSIQNFGDYIGGVNPITGKVMPYGKVGMSPDKVDASQRGWAGLAETGRHNMAAEARANNPRQQGPMSATLQKELIEADDAVQAARSVIGSIDSALKINSAAYSGFGAKPRAVVMSNIGGSKSADATIDLDNLMTGQGLDSLKAIFGAAPTEGERKILMDMQASVDKTPEQRKVIMERAKAAAERRLSYSQAKAASIRDGSYLTTGGQSPAAPAAPGKTVVKTGTYNGRKVVQYSDGSMEYAQ